MSTRLEGKAPKVAVAEAPKGGASCMRRPSSPRGTSSEPPRVVRQQGTGMWEQTKSNNLHQTPKTKLETQLTTTLNVIKFNRDQEMVRNPGCPDKNTGDYEVTNVYTSPKPKKHQSNDD